MSYSEREQHLNKYINLPEKRADMICMIEEDLTNDTNVLGVFYGGSIGNEDTDLFSDIDLRIVVKDTHFTEYKENKKERAKNWGNVLYSEGYEYDHFVVAHFNNFIKVDAFYYTKHELEPSIWFKNIKVVYDPYNIMATVQEQSQALQYAFSEDDIVAWRTKFYAYVHEAYRRALRKEYFYALYCIDYLRLSLINGWYMEKGSIPNSAGDWAKIEGSRSHLSFNRQNALEQWQAKRDFESILNVLTSMRSEFERLNDVLSQKVHIDSENNITKEVFKKIL